MKHRKFVFNVILIFISLFFMISCTNNISLKTDEINISNNDLERILKYKNSYVGDNSAVSNIVNILLGSQYINGIELQTSLIPYEIIVKCNKIENEDILKKNALVIFALISNVDIIKFNLNDNNVVIYDRNELVNIYGNQYGNNFEKIVEDISSLKVFLNIN